MSTQISGESFLPVNLDPHDEEQVREYFAKLEQDYPQIIEAMKVMNISYHQYLVAMQSLSQHSTFSSNHTEIPL